MISRMVNLFLADKVNISIMVVVMVCAVIGVLGFIKPFTFDYIKNKYVRKTALYFTSIALAFAATAIAFWVKDWNFVYYWLAGIGMACSTIITYSMYEGTNVKHIVDKVNNNTWKKWFGFQPKSAEEFKKEVNQWLDEIKPFNKNTNTIKHDKELDNV